MLRLGLMMATRSRKQPTRSLRGDARLKLKAGEDKLAAARAGISSAPNGNDGRTQVRAHSTQPPPRITTRSSVNSLKTSATGSASNINVNRNVRRNASNASPDKGLNKAFQRLSVNDKKGGKSVVARKQSTSAGNSSSCKSIEDIARRILQKKSRNVVVMAGAGISTPSGIPDFRSPGSGLYDNLKQYHIPYPEAIFDIDFFRKNPKPFFTLAKELYPSGKYRPNYVHYFVRMLYEKGVLLRMYTQNIDGLERLAGIPGEKLVEAHGKFTTCTCTKCGYEHDGEDVKDIIYADRIPRCKRPTCTGVVKPNIVFFGEDLPKRFFYYMKDMPQCDLLIIMGTSLEVYPFAGIMDSVRMFVPRLLINREAVGPFARPASSRSQDLAVTGDLVETVQKLTRVLGWKKPMEDLITENEARLDEMIASAEAKKKQTVEADVKENNADENGQEGASDKSPGKQRLTNLQRGQDTSTNIRKFHTQSLSHANSAVRSQSQAKSARAGRSSVTLPNIKTASRSAYRTRRAVVVSDSSESSSSESSDDDDSSN